MPRATSKIALLNDANEQFEKMWKIINSMTEEEQNAPFCFDSELHKDGAHWKRDKNVRDVLIHLHEWHNLLLLWEKANSSGKNIPFLPAPYTWKNYGTMNVEFWSKNQDVSLSNAKQMLANSHKEVVSIIDKYDDEQLFTKAFFKWTGSTSLGQYCISVTASHYDWAIKKFKEQVKALRS